MTRETKIGLLVGLAFIIVIGILLSDHMSATNEPPQAKLEGAGSNVRDAVTAPAGSGSPVALSGPAPASAPRAVVPTRRDLEQPPPPAVGEVQIGPGPTPAPQERRAFADRQGDSSERTAPERVATDRTGTDRTSTERAAPEAVRAAPARDNSETADASNPRGNPSGRETRDSRDNRPGRGVHELVRANPDELMEVDGPGSAARASDSPRPAAESRTRSDNAKPAPGVAEPRHYVAQANDSVTKMASRFLGSASKANIDLIIKANPSLQDDANLVVVGRTYVIPNPGTTAPATPAGWDNVAASGARSTKTSPPSEKGTAWYTVKENDNLWKIAETQLGSGNAWTAIRDANRDVLKGGETVHPNMRLRIPSKPAVAATE